MDRFGNATAVWTFNDEFLPDNVYASSLPFGGIWSPPVLISTTSGDNNLINEGFVQRPISVNLNGDVMVIYENNIFSDPELDTLYSVKKPFGAAWLTPEFISSNAAFPNQAMPHFLNIGIGSCGFALSLWQAQIVDLFDQVWSSVHSDPVLPPCNFTGSQCQEKFATQKICVNSLSWGFCDPCTVFFRLFKNGVLIATIPAGSPLFFNDPVCCKVSNTYTLTSVNIFGAESPPVAVVLP
jgi:hypothetical protein